MRKNKNEIELLIILIEETINLKNELRKLNNKIQYIEFYFFCSHCEHTNDGFTDDEQIVDGVKCESCNEENYFNENKQEAK